MQVLLYEYLKREAPQSIAFAWLPRGEQLAYRICIRTEVVKATMVLSSSHLIRRHASSYPSDGLDVYAGSSPYPGRRIVALHET